MTSRHGRQSSSTRMRRRSSNKLYSRVMPVMTLWGPVKPFGSKLEIKIPFTVTSFRPLRASRRKSPPPSARCGRAWFSKTPASQSQICKRSPKRSTQQSASQCSASAPSGLPSPPQPSPSASSTSSSSPSSASPSSCPSTPSSSHPAGTRPSNTGNSSSCAGSARSWPTSSCP